MPAPYRFGQALGMLATSSGTNTTNLSAAANWGAVSFVPDSARTLSTIRVYFSSVTGTLAAGDITCSLYDSTGGGNGKPGSSIETGKLPSATITAAGFYTFTGFSTALTAGQVYWLVFKNGNASPASNYASLRVVTFLTMGPLTGSYINRFIWSQSFTTDSGANWTAQSTCNSSLRVGYADGTYDGLPIYSDANAAVGDGVYSTRESGVKFTSPANVSLNVSGIAMYIGTKTGSPTGSPRFGLWTGESPSLLAYTNSLTTTSVGSVTSQWAYSYFSSIQSIPAGTVCRVTLGETTQSDTSSNYYCLRETGYDTDANSTILLPMNGTATKTYYNGSSWSDSTLGTSLFGFALLLDTAGEFTSAGGGLAFPSSGRIVG